MTRFEPQYRKLGPEDFQFKPKPAPQPELRQCVLCFYEEEVWPDERRDTPFFCMFCSDPNRSTWGVVKPPLSDPVWSTDFGKHYRRALIAWWAIEKELTRLRYQKRSGKMGEHPAWWTMTREAREAWANQPAPPRAFMP